MEEAQPGPGNRGNNNDNNTNISSNSSSKGHGEGKMATGAVGESGGGDVVGTSNGQPEASVGANPGGGGGERSDAQSQPTRQAGGDEKDKPSALNRYSNCIVVSVPVRLLVPGHARVLPAVAWIRIVEQGAHCFPAWYHINSSL